MPAITYFVEGNKYYETAKVLLGQSKKRIYLLMYQISLKGKALELVEEIAKASMTIPDTQFILNYEGNKSLKKGVVEFLKQFKEHNVSVYIMEKITAHAKVLIIDNWLLLGSSNLSQGGLEENFEANIVTNDPKAVWGAVQWFNKVKDNATPVKQ